MGGSDSYKWIKKSRKVGHLQLIDERKVCRACCRLLEQVTTQKEKVALQSELVGDAKSPCSSVT